MPVALLLSLGLHGVIFLGLGLPPMMPRISTTQILNAVLIWSPEQAAPNNPSGEPDGAARNASNTGKPSLAAGARPELEQAAGFKTASADPGTGAAVTAGKPALTVGARPDLEQATSFKAASADPGTQAAATAGRPPLTAGARTKSEQTADFKAASPNLGTDMATAQAPSLQQGAADYLALREEIAAFGLDAAERDHGGAAGPRIQRLSSASAKSAAEAAYLEMWRQRVERIGNANYPADAGYGDMRLQVLIGYDGALLDARVVESSGVAALDAAALRILGLAAPFAQFSVDMRKSYDQLEITRRWRFSRSGAQLAD